MMNIAPDTVSKFSNLYNNVAFVIPDSKNAGIEQGKIIIDLWNNNKEA